MILYLDTSALVKRYFYGYIDRVVEKYPLRGFDAIHLASAIVVHERLSEDFVFACFDERLTVVAQSEGFKTFPQSAAHNL